MMVLAARPPRAQGFSLIEVMVAMLVASVGIMSLTTLTISSLNANTLARERIAATNLAVEVIESWQASTTDTLPTLVCANGSIQLTTGIPGGTQSSCQLNSGEVKTSFTITISTQAVQAPLPPNPAGAPVLTDLYAGLRITALLIDKNNSAVIYAGTHGDGLFKSADSGATWSKVYGSAFSKVNALLQQPPPSPIIIAATDSYTLANTNWGGTWQQLKTGLANANILALATDSYSMLYAGEDLYTFNTGGIYTSTNDGYSWIAANGASLANLSIHALATDTYAYAGSNNGVYRSNNSGASWSWRPAATTDTYATIYSLATSPTSAGTLYAGSNKEVVISSDWGETWLTNIWSGTAPNTPFRALAIGTDNAGNQILYAGSDKGIYKDAATSLASLIATGIPLQADLRTYSLVTKPTADPYTLYAGTDGGLFKSTDQGAHWTRSDLGDGSSNSAIGLIPKEKVVKVSWTHKTTPHQVTLTHITERPY
ncbi:MAG: prepilin-type N-terminal cleavage/methylation domain-containing protein [Mariprofundales bacterium]|nr:prepilin-type N-terminal cleavage/methylation domain-containing protein [Mariprofundales bacterium]